MGGTDFSIIGRPLIQDGLVKVQATVIEKALSHTKTHFKMKRRKQYKRINCKQFSVYSERGNSLNFFVAVYRIEQTMLRINKIHIVGEVNKPPAVTGLETAIL